MPYRQNFPIPAVIDPPRQCLCIRIPNHPDWKAVIAGGLAELRYWYNWERTDGTEGAQCAAVWKSVFDSIDWSDMSCCCDDKPPAQYQYTALGVLQVSVDGGLTFTDAPQDDVRNNSPKFPPVPGDDGSDKKCAAATGAALLVKEQVGDQLTDDMGRYTFQNFISDWLHTMVEEANPFTALVTVVANQIFALVISAIMAALNDDVYHLFACALYCSMADDASFNDAQWAAARSKILSDIGGIAGVFLEHLIYMLGKVGTTNLVRSAPDDTGDCSDCDCPVACAQQWVEKLDPGSFYGTITEQTDEYVVITCDVLNTNNVYYGNIWTADADKCCYINLGGIELVSGGDGTFGVAVSNCGGFSLHTGFTEGCVNWVQPQCAVPFVVKITFVPCP